MTDTVTVNAPVTYKAWKAPNYAMLDLPRTTTAQLGGAAQSREAPSVCVKDLHPAALDALAQQWLDHLYASAGRPSPFTLAA